jgi:hypothetical protein
MLYVVLGLVALVYLLLRPRRGGPGAPPVAASSPVYPIPLIGPLLEFFSSPNTMVQRCFEQLGPVFTISVRGVYVERVLHPIAKEYLITLLVSRFRSSTSA